MLHTVGRLPLRLFSVISGIRDEDVHLFSRKDALGHPPHFTSTGRGSTVVHLPMP